MRRLNTFFCIIRHNHFQRVMNIALMFISISCASGMAEVLVRYRVLAWPFESSSRGMAYLTKKDINLRWRYSNNEGRNSLGLRNKGVMPKDIPFVDLTGELFKNGGTRLFADYLHLNAKGNDVVADAVGRDLENRLEF